MDETPSGLARELLSSAHALITELHEEGVERFDPLTETPTEAARRELQSAPEESCSAGVEPPPSRPSPTESPLVTSAQPQDLLVESPLGEQPTLEGVREALRDCTRCRLCEGRTNLVFGDGNPEADLMFIGEGPGETEDRRGLPFVGRAGELLTQMIENGLGIPRSDVYICNIVKCRPPGNRTPAADEVTTCRPFLFGQIDAIRPRVIVALGKPATSLLLGRDVPITKVRGHWFEYRGIPLMPTFHPAYVLRQYTPEVRRNVWEDLKAALARSLEETPC